MNNSLGNCSTLLPRSAGASAAVLIVPHVLQINLCAECRTGQTPTWQGLQVAASVGLNLFAVTRTCPATKSSVSLVNTRYQQQCQAICDARQCCTDRMDKGESLQLWLGDKWKSETKKNIGDVGLSFPLFYGMYCMLCCFMRCSIALIAGCPLATAGSSYGAQA